MPGPALLVLGGRPRGEVVVTVQPDEQARAQRGRTAQEHSVELLADVRVLLARSEDRCRQSRDVLETSYRMTLTYRGHLEGHS